jgi:predicted membrane channel-forming protein YqfA (hemolysin III family)
MKLKINSYPLCAFILLFAIETFIAVFIRDDFIRPYAGDILVVVLIYCFIKIFTQKDHRLLPLYIFIFAAFVELCQYFRIVNLLGLHENKIIGIIAGSVFDMKDIICYLIGCIGLMLFDEGMRRIKKRENLIRK